MEKRRVLRTCVHCKTRQRAFLFYATQEPRYARFVTSVCECQRAFFDQRKSLGLDGTFWTEEMLDEFVPMVERGALWRDIEKHINMKFGVALSGRQRPKGKGYDGAVVKKWDNLRIGVCDWHMDDADGVLMHKALNSMRMTKQNREDRGFESLTHFT